MRFTSALGVLVVLSGVAASVVADRGFSPAAANAARLTPELAEKERRSCVTCHTAMGRATLNPAGTYYKEHGSFEGYTGELPARVPENAPPRPESPTPPVPPTPPPPENPPGN